MLVLATMILNDANNWKGIFKLTIDGKTLDSTVTDYQVKEVIDENYGKDYDTVITGDATQKKALQSQTHVRQLLIPLKKYGKIKKIN